MFEALCRPLFRVAAIVLLWGSPALAQEFGGRLESGTRWQESVRLTGSVEIPPGVTLEIAPGTEVRVESPDHRMLVRGRLRGKGTAEAPIVFSTPAQWQGIEFMEPDGRSYIDFARFEGGAVFVSGFAAHLDVRGTEFRAAETAVNLVRDCVLRVEKSRFFGNETGIRMQMKSRAEIIDSRFEKHDVSAIVSSHGSRASVTGNVFNGNEQAIGIQGKFPGEIRDNHFRDNRVGIFCNQSQNTPVISGNRFEDHENALVNLSFSYPVVQRNSFIANQTAMRNDQFGSAGVFHNLFAGNGTAVHNNRKSNPELEKNIFRENELALFCDYSSYPRVKNNNFIGNEMAVKLGTYQSADFEGREGSRGLVMQQAQQRRSRNPLLDQAPDAFSDRVDVSGNWWGDRTAILEDAGEDGNLAFFHDRHDQPTVRYEGWGEKEFTLDRVVFAPWLEAPVADAGPEVKQ
jgi:parallel beta-helix repeat protein